MQVDEKDRKLLKHPPFAGEIVAITLEPKAAVGEFAYLQVKDVASFSAFLDWGFEKDLLVPSSQQQDRMKIGKSYVVKVCLDELTGRVYGTNRITHNCDKNPKDLSEGEKVDLLIYGITKIGIMAVNNIVDCKCPER
ncbi:MAG: hypothetical protein EHM85_16865 [Desulfobacteraceae bacterium]|nr:MAG: hypothetical protein EHM85_16865 [Desulfobacteraceae bacterium]